MKALQAFVETAEGADLLAGYKRAANILKKEDWTTTPATRRSERMRFPTRPRIEETELDEALDAAEPQGRGRARRRGFRAARWRRWPALRAPVDAFFDKVTVNDPDPAKREARLDLLARMRDAVHRVADFSRIEG